MDTVFLICTLVLALIVGAFLIIGGWAIDLFLYARREQKAERR